MEKKRAFSGMFAASGAWCPDADDGRPAVADGECELAGRGLCPDDHGAIVLHPKAGTDRSQGIPEVMAEDGDKLLARLAGLNLGGEAGLAVGQLLVGIQVEGDQSHEQLEGGGRRRCAPKLIAYRYSARRAAQPR